MDNAIEIDSAAGPLRLRPERAEDEGFRFALFCQSRPAEFALLQLDTAAMEQLMRIQFRAQTAGYRGAFPEAQLRIVERAGTPIGRIVIDRSAAGLRIVDQALLAAERNRGIGSAIMRQLIDEARDAGLPLRLKVAATNTAAARLYLRLGFVAVETEPMSVEMEWQAQA
jgi:ribosomal protein S18 acetylase RimI-like enzyme